MAIPLNILIVEDSQDDAELLMAEMRRAGFKPKWKRVETEPDYLTEIKKSPDIIFSDYSMPRFSGLRAAELLRESGLDIPFILISGTLGEDAAVEAMKHGATDYLLKDRVARLGLAVEHAVEQKRLREQRKVAEQQLRIQSSALEAAANAILITDRQGKIVSANTAFCIMSGYALEEIMGQNPRFLKSGEHNADFYRQLWQTVTAGEVWRGEITNRRKDGTTYLVELTITPVRADGGEITHFIAVEQDITERKRVEEDLRATHAQLGQFLQYSPAVLYALKVKGQDVSPYLVSENMNALLGFTVQEAMTYEWWAGQLHPEERSRVVASVSETIAHDASHTEYRLRHKDGSYRWVEDNRRLVRDADGRPTDIVGVWTDITERKKIQNQMLRAQRLESIGTLAGGIAHDLNNSLAPILMAIELMRMQYPDAKEVIDTVERSAKRGADMVRQLLTFAKGIEGERLLIQSRHLIKELEKILKISFPKNIQLSINCSPKLQAVLGDVTQLHQVLLNLCVNARDAMPNGGALTIEAENAEIDAVYAANVPEAKPGHYVVWRVIDTGTGIPPEILGRIFEPFFSTKGPDKGTGLGLSTVFGIVKSHGGFVRVYSQPGHGSTFTIYLPDSGSSKGDTEMLIKTEGSFRGNGETILVVDDEVPVRQIARSVLAALNFQVVTAANGTEALLQVADKRAELRAVITDMHMPHMDGLNFVRVLKHTLPQVGIIVTSGHLNESETNEFKALGVTVVLNKPFTQEKLVEALRTILKNETMSD